MGFLTPIEKDYCWKQRVWKEHQSARIFPQKWGWVQRDIHEMEKELAEISKKSEFLRQVFIEEHVDTRTIKPIPESVNHQYGWIPSKPEFHNKIPDHSKLMELPSSKKLFIPYKSPYWCYLKS